MYCIHRAEKRKNVSGGLELENNRTSNTKNFHEFTNSDIDYSRTSQNIYLVKNENWNKKINDEIKAKVNKKVRKDAVKAIDSLYTASRDFFDGKSKEEITNYFKDCLKFNEEKYGKTINAVIHFDETTPHMHVLSVPIIDGCLSAKKVMGNRQDYSNRQDEFYEKVGKKFGLERGESSNTKYKKLAEFKRESEEKKLKEIEKKLEEAKKISSEISLEKDFFEKANRDLKELENSKKKNLLGGISFSENAYKKVFNNQIDLLKTAKAFQKLSVENAFKDKKISELNSEIDFVKKENLNDKNLLKKIGIDKNCPDYVIDRLSKDFQKYQKLDHNLKQDLDRKALALFIKSDEKTESSKISSVAKKMKMSTSHIKAVISAADRQLKGQKPTAPAHSFSHRASDTDFRADQSTKSIGLPPPPGASDESEKLFSNWNLLTEFEKARRKRKAILRNV